MTKAGEAKNVSEIAEEKDIISISVIQAQSENRYGNLEENNFSETLNKNSKTGNKASIIASDTSSFTVKFESNRYYEVDKNGSINHIENVTGEKTLTIQCVNSKNEVLGEYEYTIVTDRYSKLPPNVEKYESSEEKIEGEMTENKTVKVLYYLICNDDRTLLFTPIDSNGNIVTEENATEYMVGDGSKTSGNGLIEKNIQSVLIIPENYNGKQVTKVGTRAFENANNIITIKVGDNVKSLNWCFSNMRNVESVTLGKNLSSIEGHTFWGNSLKTIIFRCNTIPTWFQAFGGCDKLKVVKLEENEETYKVEDNIVYSKDGKTLIFFPTGRTGEYTIPNTIEKIGKWAFANSYLSHINIGGNITSLPERCFNGSVLTSMYIGENVKTVGQLAFGACDELKTVVIDSPTFASILTSEKSAGQLLSHVTRIYINENIETSLATYVKENYNRDTNVEAEDYKSGYVKYIK